MVKALIKVRHGPHAGWDMEHTLLSFARSREIALQLIYGAPAVRTRRMFHWAGAEVVEQLDEGVRLSAHEESIIGPGDA